MYDNFQGISDAIYETQRQNKLGNDQLVKLYKDLESSVAGLVAGGAASGAAAGGAGGSSAMASILGGLGQDDDVETMFLTNTKRGTSVSDGKNVVDTYDMSSSAGGNGIDEETLAKLAKKAGLYGKSV